MLRATRKPYICFGDVESFSTTLELKKMADSVPRNRYEAAPCFETMVDVVGLEHSTNGRCCERHDVCGSVVEINAVLMLEKTYICELTHCVILQLYFKLKMLRHSEWKPGRSCNVSSYWFRRCTPVPSRVFTQTGVCRAHLYHQRLVQVAELMSYSNSSNERSFSYRMGGVAKCVLIC